MKRGRAAKPGPVRVPARGVAALFLERQHLERPRERRLSADRLRRFAEDVGGIQLDTINVVERAHHLTLWSRFGPYDRSALDRLLYRRRVLFEYWAHAACLVPSTDLPMWRHAMGDLRWSSRAASWRTWLRKNRALVAAVEDAVRERGPLGSIDFEHPRPGERGTWWSGRKPATHALDYLWMSGRLMVHSRRHFHKRFDLAERVFPQMARESDVAPDDFRRWHLRRSLHAMGAATETDLQRYLTFPGGAAKRRPALIAALEAGEVIEVAPDPPEALGKPTRWFALTEDLPALERAGRRRAPSRGTTLLSPFDSLLWHRDRAKRLFGYDYKIEVYVPAPQRRHGYYSLPIFHDGHLIGRLDPKTHREERRLEVKHVHFEPWFARGAEAPGALGGRVDRDAALAGVAASLGSLARFVGADRVTLGRVTPKAIGGSLTAAMANEEDHVRTPHCATAVE